MTDLRIGTSAFTAAGWPSTFYPEGLPEREYLTYYATKFDTVEVDSTFYRTPSIQTVKGWNAKTPPGFLFAAKIPQVITHEKVLVDCGAEFSEFLKVMDALGEKLGPLLLQFGYFNKGLSILKCIYDESEHDCILEDLINLAGTLIEGDKCDNAVTALFIGLFKFAPALKDPSFFEEHEWRVVSDFVLPKDQPLRFRAGRSMLIPYQEFKLAKDGQKMPISRVIVGPTPHMNLSISSLGYRLASSANVNPDTCAIAPSRVPFRSW